MKQYEKTECLELSWKVYQLLKNFKPSKPYQSKKGSCYIRIRRFYIRISDHAPRKNFRIKWVLYICDPYRKKKYEYGYCEIAKMLKDVNKFLNS